MLKISDTRRFGYNRIVVIESLPKRAKKTGKALYDDIISKRAFQIEGLTHEYIPVETRRNLTRALQRIADEVNKKGRMPFLHFEAHGQKNGMELQSGDFISWKELALFLRKINVATQHNLVISFATCFAGWVYLELDLDKRAPFFAFIGPFTEVSEHEIENGFTNFFDSLLTGVGMVESLICLNEGCITEPIFSFMDAETSLFKAYTHYKEDFSNPERFRGKVLELMGEALHDLRVRQTMSIPVLRQNIIEQLGKSDEVFLEIKRKFLMEDLRFS